MRVLAALLVLSALSGCASNPLAGRASAVEVCRDVASVAESVRAGSPPAAAALVEIEARLRLGVDDPAVQEAGSRLRTEALAAADALRGGGSLADVGPGLLEAATDLAPACEDLGVSL